MLCGRFPSLCGCSKATSLPFRENLRKPLRPMARHGPSSCGELSSRFLRPELSRQSCFRSSQPGTSFSSLLSSSKTPPSRQHRFFLRDMSGLKDSSTWALLRQQHSSPLCPACWSSRSFNASLCLGFLPDRLRDNNVSTTRYLFTQFLTHRYERHQMTVHRRTTTLLAVAASTALALAGCSTTNTEATGPIPLTFSSPAFQDATVKATTDIVDSWNKANPTIQIKYQKVDPNSVHDKLVPQFAGDSAPDIIQDESSDLAGFTLQEYRQLRRYTPCLQTPTRSRQRGSHCPLVISRGRGMIWPPTRQNSSLQATDTDSPGASSRPRSGSCPADSLSVDSTFQEEPLNQRWR